MKEKIIFNWSTGKDSALSVYKILQSNQYQIHTLLTSVNSKFQRVSMHGVRIDLLEEQAKQMNLPLTKMMIPESPSMEDYEQIMADILTPFINEGITKSAFGDIFLEDLKKYREDKLQSIGMEGLFPLWGIPTTKLISQYLDLGFKAVVTCVNATFLDKSFVGRVLDQSFVNDLPPNVDPCGENGEFHTFVFDGPIFNQPIPYELGEIVYKTYTAPAKDTNDVCSISENKQVKEDYGFWYVDIKKI